MKFFHETFRHLQTKTVARKPYEIALESNSLRALKLLRKKRYREALKHLEICEVYKLHYNSLPDTIPIRDGFENLYQSRLPTGDRD